MKVWRWVFIFGTEIFYRFIAIFGIATVSLKFNNTPCAQLLLTFAKSPCDASKAALSATQYQKGYTEYAELSQRQPWAFKAQAS
jgi:hypothetical protein